MIDHDRSNKTYRTAYLIDGEMRAARQKITAAAAATNSNNKNARVLNKQKYHTGIKMKIDEYLFSSLSSFNEFVKKDVIYAKQIDRLVYIATQPHSHIVTQMLSDHNM